jgi:DNA-binding transcriptional LysR family regulator
MELRQLRYFAEVARAGTYAAAAERLHVAQPGVWKQVRLLERELDVVLLERVGRGARLTAAGALVLAQAEAVLAGVNRVGDLGADLRAGVAGSVTVGCVSAHVVGFLSRLVAAHRRLQPGVRVRLEEIDVSSTPADGSDPFLEALAARAVDVVTASSGAGGFEGFPIYDVHVVAVAGPRHRWRKRQEIHVRELEGEPILAMPAGYLSRTLLERACGHVGVGLSIVMISSSPIALLALGRDGVGVPILASDAVPPQARPLPVVVDDRGPLRQTVSLYARPLQDRPPAVAAFVEHARRLADA